MSTLVFEGSKAKVIKILLAARRYEPVGNLLSEVLKLEGFEVTIVESAEEVLSELQNLKYDIVLPTNNSLHHSIIPDLVTEIRKKHPGVSIIVLSGFYNPDYVNILARSGVDDLLPMPFRMEELRSRIQKTLSNKKII